MKCEICGSKAENSKEKERVILREYRKRTAKTKQDRVYKRNKAGMLKSNKNQKDLLTNFYQNV